MTIFRRRQWRSQPPRKPHLQTMKLTGRHSGAPNRPSCNDQPQLCRWPGWAAPRPFPWER
eukprot:4046941-Lingulodinium_polyedra.AAC.1